MARIQYGVGVVGVRGTAGGTTFSQNRSGSYVKAYARGPRSALANQQMTRATVSYMGYAWQGLSDGQRADWAAFALSPPEVDHNAFGGVIELSGFSWMCRCGTRTLLTTGNISAVAGPTTPIPPCSPYTLDLHDLSTGYVDNWIHTDPADWLVAGNGVLFGALLRGGGTLQAQRGFRMLHVFSFGDGGDYNFAGDIMRVFGAVPAGWVLQTMLYRQSPWGVRSVGLGASGTFA